MGLSLLQRHSRGGGNPCHQPTPLSRGHPARHLRGHDSGAGHERELASLPAAASLPHPPDRYLARHAPKERPPHRCRYRRHLHRHRAADPRRAPGDRQAALHARPTTPMPSSTGVIARHAAARPDPATSPRSCMAARSPPTPSSSTRAPGPRSITTQGFRDVLELRRMRVPRLYDPLWRKPAPLVPRHLRFEVDRADRRRRRGRRARSTRRASMRRSPPCATPSVEAVAVCLLHAYANPAHEQRDRRPAAGRAARPLRLAVDRGAAADPRVRAHQHDRGQRLRRPAGEALPLRA